MTSAQALSLFDQFSEVGLDDPVGPVGCPTSDLPTTGTHRRSDPPTSVAAAQSLDPETMHRELRRVMAVITAAGDHGATAGEINDRLGDRQRNCTARRVRDLVDGGLVTDSGRVRRLDRKGARDEIVWQVS